MNIDASFLTVTLDDMQVISTFTLVGESQSRISIEAGPKNERLNFKIEYDDASKKKRRINEA